MVDSTTKTYQIDISVFVRADSEQELEGLKDSFAYNIQNTEGWDVFTMSPPKEIANNDIEKLLNRDPEPNVNE